MKNKIAGVILILIFVAIAALFWRNQSQQKVAVSQPAQKVISLTSHPEIRENAVDVSAPTDFTNDIETLSDSENMRAVSPEENEEHLKLAQDLEQLEKVFDEVEDRWNKQMRDLLITEFGLGEEEYKTYQQLREEYDMAKIQAFENYHQKLEEIHGQDAVYRMTLAEEEFQAPIQSEYESRMHKLFGDDLFQRYLGIRDQFNHDLRADAETQMPLFFIDL